MYEIKILSPAWNDLDRIADMHLSMVGVQSAKNVTDGILNRIELLGTFPFSCPTVPDEELSGQGYRMAIYKKYLAIYRVIGNVVYIYHIADGRANYPQIIKGYK